VAKTVGSRVGHARRVTAEDGSSREIAIDARHDIVHAASTILMLVAALRSRDQDAAARGALDGIAHSAHEITAMVNDINGRHAPDALDLAPLATDAGDRARVLFPGTLTVQAETAPVRAPELDVSRLLTNLLQNACRAAAPDGVVQLTVTNESSWCVMRIGDSGAGFVEQPTSGGLGLALVVAITVRLDGHVTFGRSPLGGALVAVHLPRAEGQERSGEPTDHLQERVS
jgi:signal transduction histidine kinase